VKELQRKCCTRDDHVNVLYRLFIGAVFAEISRKYEAAVVKYSMQIFLKLCNKYSQFLSLVYKYIACIDVHLMLVCHAHYCIVMNMWN